LHIFVFTTTQIVVPLMGKENMLECTRQFFREHCEQGSLQLHST
jgi:hypothetical protein